MPRLISSLSRLLKLVLLSWLTLIGLWTFLPFPTIPADSNNDNNNNIVYPGGHHEYIQETLRSGQILHTVQKWSPSFSANSALLAVPGFPSQRQQLARVASPPDECSSLLIDWRLVSDSAHDDSVVLLEMGRDLRARVNLTDAILKVHDHHDDDNENGNANVHGVDDDAKNVYISDQFTVEVDAGDQDHIINMPWFHWTDAALFHNQMHDFTYDIQLRIVAHRETNTVEIWKAATLHEFEQSQHVEPGAGLKAIDFTKMSPSDRSKGLLASFSNFYPNQNSAGNMFAGIHVTDMQSSELPSKTYKLRSLILVPLAPSLMVAFFLLSEVFTPLLFPVVFPVLLAYIIIVLICWAYYQYQHGRRRRNSSRRRYDYGYGFGGSSFDRMGFGEWCSRFWMTRYVYSVCCCCCCRSRRGRNRNGQRNSYHRYWAGEKSSGGRKVPVIWGPAGPVYEE